LTGISCSKGAFVFHAQRLIFRLSKSVRGVARRVAPRDMPSRCA
jgi:hypothetical protein